MWIGISQYGSFRSGLDFLATDVKRLSESVISESLFLSRSRHSNIVRVEARIGVIGSLKKIVDEIDFIGSRVGEDDPANLARRMERLKDDILRMLDNLQDPKDEPYVRENLLQIFDETIPLIPMPAPRKLLDTESAAFYREQRNNLRKALVKA